uniref:Plasmid sequence n=1 Tax=Clostridium botulinum TaxID=1491 RepID=R4NG04_CLOBO|nr:plasmid sequence [Clostridium botulinum]AGL45059.1 plasmid sequence [Clostridium botulinum]AGL45099.1 plasmid sequence [Clostridium botulinum]AGL45139.1 plasmid sequence [Clostridium botulinum]AGL45179.1 plasmid sequence [Clostridium botulinum]
MPSTFFTILPLERHINSIPLFLSNISSIVNSIFITLHLYLVSFSFSFYIILNSIFISVAIPHIPNIIMSFLLKLY